MPNMRSTLIADLLRAGSSKGSFLSFFQKFLLDSGFKAVVLFRLANWLQRRGWNRIAFLVAATSLAKTGADIVPCAKIGPGFVIKHPVGVVIGSGCSIGRNFTVLQGVTLGEKYSSDGKHEYPIIGDNVTVCAGSMILGKVRVGDNAVIGANSVVLRNVPQNCVVAGMPARIIRKSTKKIQPKVLDDLIDSVPVLAKTKSLQAPNF